MKRVLAAFILAAFSVNALASIWVNIGQTEKGNTYYFDKTSGEGIFIKKIVDGWFLVDLKNPQKIGEKMPFRSYKNQVYVNCSDGTLSMTGKSIFYSGRRGSGEVIFTDDGGKDEFETPAPESMEEAMYQAICHPDQ